MPDKTNHTRNSHDIHDRKTQWHMAVTPAIRLELMEYQNILEYISERLLRSCRKISDATCAGYFFEDVCQKT